MRVGGVRARSRVWFCALAVASACAAKTPDDSTAAGSEPSSSSSPGASVAGATAPSSAGSAAPSPTSGVRDAPDASDPASALDGGPSAGGGALAGEDASSAPAGPARVTLEHELADVDIIGLALSGDTLATCLFGRDGNRGDLSVGARGTADWSEQQSLLGMGSFAGFSAVALSGDTLVVPEYAKSQTALVFERGASGFVQAAELVVPQSFETSLSGQAAIDGDTIAASSTSSSSVFVFVRAGAGWSLQQRLFSAHASSNDALGGVLALDGDTLVVGAPDQGMMVRLRGSGGPGTSSFYLPGMGAVYVFQRSAGVWSEQAYLQADDPTARVRFGASVAVAGDLLFVGSPGETVAAAGATADMPSAEGAVYVFERSAGHWSRSLRLTAPHPHSGDSFGQSVASDGARLAVSAPIEASTAQGIDGDELDTSSPGNGAVFLFERGASGDWKQAAYVKAEHPDVQPSFGEYLALDGDTLVIGRSAQSHPGSVSIYRVAPHTP